MKYLLKNLEFPSTQSIQPSTVKNELLNHKHCGKWFPVLKNTIVSTDPLKETIEIIIVGVLLSEILILLFLKHRGEWISKFKI